MKKNKPDTDINSDISDFSADIPGFATPIVDTDDTAVDTSETFNGTVETPTGTADTVDTVTVIPVGTQKIKVTRARVPKIEVALVIDAGRSAIKCQAFVDGEPKSPVQRIESIVCSTDFTPDGELGAYTLCRGKSEAVGDEKPKDITEHWVVGNSAKFQQRDYISMSEGDNHKITYFPILVAGAIASLPNLHELSTGTTDKNRTLNIRLTALSLAPSNLLRGSVEQCRWLKIEGCKYRLSFGKQGFMGLPEGYGAALYGKSRIDTSEFLTFDIGFGTSTITGYSNLGKLPKREMCSPNGGGGIATLIREFSNQSGQSDSAKMIKRTQLREILETSTIEDEKITAISPEGQNIGNHLELAIRNWIKDSQLTNAIDDLSTAGRKKPIVLCGGGFAIPPVKELVYKELVKVGIPKEHLLIPVSPETISLSEISQLFTHRN